MPFRSEAAMRLLVAVSQRGGATTLREVARALDIRDSSAQRAVAALQRTGLLRRVGRRYVADDRHPASREALVVALASLDRSEAIRTLVRANDGVEFAAFADPALCVVYRNSAGASDELRLEAGVALLRPAVALEGAIHDDLVATLLSQPSVRERFMAGEVLKGTAARSLPDRSRHGDFPRARVLGAVHPDVDLPSRRALADIARRYALKHIGLFGSSVREDFRPDSDVDVLVRFRPDARAGYGTLAALRGELEGLLDRDVDVVEDVVLSPRARRNVEREEVVLVGRA